MGVGDLPEICGACSVPLPLRPHMKCYRAYCQKYEEDMTSLMGRIRDDEREEEEQRRLDREQTERTILRPPTNLMEDSGDKFLEHLFSIAQEDAIGLKKAQASYGNSWKSRGGTGAFMMLARKWDRLENRAKKPSALGGEYDIFAHIAADERSEGIIDDIRDLRRYLLLVEAELVARGFKADHRDNK